MLESKIQKIARQTIKKHPVKREWKIAILMALLLRLLTMAVSVYAGIYYLHNIAIPIFKNYWVALIISVTALIFIEGIIMVFMNKGFKFLFKKEALTTAASFLAVALFWAISFHISTNGLAQRQSDQVDKSTNIVEKYQTRIDNLKNRRDKRIRNIENSIEEIRNNPGGWVGGSREVLTSGQQERIQNYYERIAKIRQNTKNRISTIKQNKQKELQENRQKQTNTADLYYKIVAVLLIIQLIVTGIFIFLLTRVWEEENQEDYVQEKIEPVKESIQESMMSTVFEYIAMLQKKINTSLASTVEEDDPLPEKEANKIQQTIGFITGQSTNNKENEPTDNPTDVNNGNDKKSGKNHSKTGSKIPNSFTEFKNMFSHISKTKYLQKHQKITQKLLERRADVNNQPSLAKISRNTQKSYSTVQNVQRVLNEVIDTQNQDNYEG